MSAVGPRYKAVSVKRNTSDHSTWLTAKIEGQKVGLDGQRILSDINNAVCNKFVAISYYLCFLAKICKHLEIVILNF